MPSRPLSHNRHKNKIGISRVSANKTLMSKVILLSLLCLALLQLASLPLYAQESSDTNEAFRELNLQISSARENVEQSSNLAQEESDQAIDDLDDAERLVELATRQSELASTYENDAASASEKVNDVNIQIKQLNAKKININSDLSSEELENQLLITVSEQNNLLSDISSTQNRLSDLSARSNEIPDELLSARENYNQFEQELERQPTAPSGLLATAKFLQKKASLLKFKETIDKLEREIATIPARQTIVEAELQLDQAKSKFLEEEIKALRGLLAEDRSVNLNRILQQNELSLEQYQQGSALFEFANESLLLAKRLNKLQDTSLQSESSTNDMQVQLQEVNQSSETVERVLATGRVTDELGELLRRLRASLPRESSIESRKAAIEEQEVRRQLDVILWQEQLRYLSEPRKTASKLLMGLAFDENNTTPKDKQIEDFSEAQLQETIGLIESRREILDELIGLARFQADSLANEELIINQLLSATRALRELLEQRLIWLPSSSGKAGNLVVNLRDSIAWLVAPSNWWELVLAIYDGVKNVPLLPMALILLALLIIYVRKLLKKRLKSLVEQVGDIENDSYITTPRAVLLTLVLALPLPLILFAAASLIASDTQDSVFASSFATALGAVSSLSFVLLFFRSMCRKDGLFEKHFGWSNKARGQLQKMLTWFIWLQAVVAFFFALSLASQLTELRYGLALVAFMIGSLGISIFTYQFFRPKDGVVTNIVGDTSASVFAVISFPFVVFIPFAIGVLPLFGFFDTAVELQSKLFNTGILLILCATIYGLMLRTFLVAFRRYIAKRDEQARQEAIEAQENEKSEASGDATPSMAEEKSIDKEEVKRQSRSIMVWITIAIFLTGLWFIWIPLLPALGIVDDIVLWQETRVVDGVELSSGVTLWNIIIALGFIVGGFIAAKNIRGVMEIGFFERFEMDAGARYAVLTILGYVLVGAGLVIGFSQLGIDWSKLQWIIAALGVGLGFGLQEIVANFVSGLIILFERPIRVGDVVTIGEVSGTVSNIKIRATTITDFDNQEVLLPNKAIITENVTNWTLHDQVTRVVIKIGVAYGSDIDKVRALLIKVVEEQEEILDEPASQVLFMEHGDSSLNFEVRVFVGRTGERLPLVNTLNSKINTVFAQNDISIPFPQRDLHIVSGLPETLAPRKSEQVNEQQEGKPKANEQQQAKESSKVNKKNPAS